MAWRLSNSNSGSNRQQAVGCCSKKQEALDGDRPGMIIDQLLREVDVDRPLSWAGVAQKFVPALRNTIRMAEANEALTAGRELLERIQQSIQHYCDGSLKGDEEAAQRVLRHARALLATAEAATALRKSSNVSELPLRDVLDPFEEAVRFLGGETGETFLLGYLRESDSRREVDKLLARLEHFGDQAQRHGWKTAGALYWTRYWILSAGGWSTNPRPDPREPSEYMLAPVTGVTSVSKATGASEVRGYAGELRLEQTNEAGALFCHPATALQLCDSRSLLPTLEQGFRDRGGQDGVCWSLHWSDGQLRPSEGDSLGAAIRTAFRLLDSADYDPNCLLMATADDDGGQKLGSVTFERQKIEAVLVQRGERNSKLRVGLPPIKDGDRHNLLRLQPHEQAVFKDGGVEFERLAILEDAVRFASERQVGVRRYLEDLRDRPNLRKQPLYLEGKKPSELYIEPDVVETTEDREDPQAQEERDRGSSRPQYEPDFGMLYGERPHERDKRAPWKSYVERLQSGNLRAAILHGAPGTGKSHLLEMLASDLAGKLVPANKPVQLQLDALEPVALLSADRLAAAYRDYIAETTSRASSFVAAALMSRRRQDEGVELTEAVARYLEKRLRHGGGWLLIDAVDEVQEINKAVLLSLFEELRQWKCRLVITSRKYAWTEDLQRLFEEKPLEMASFTSEQAEDYVNLWFGDDTERGQTTLEAIDRNPAVAAMAQNPYLATLLCWVSSLGMDLESITKTRLYELVLRRLVGTTKDRYDDRQAKRLLRRLASIAYRAFSIHAAIEPFSEEDLLDHISESTLEDLHKRRLLLLVATKSEDGLTEGDGYHFAHRSMLEYLVARRWARMLSRTARTGKEWRKVDDRVWNPDWQEVVIFTTGCLADPDRRTDQGEAAARLLELLSDEAKDDLCRSRLALAGKCLPEVAARMEHRQQLERIATTGLESWEKNLKEGVSPLNLRLEDSLPAMARALSSSAVGVAAITEPLLALSYGPSREGRIAAVDVLGSLGRVAATETVVGRLLDLLRTPDEHNEHLRWAAARALLNMGGVEAAEGVVRMVVAVLKDARDEPVIAAKALRTLGERRSAVELVLPFLLDLARDSSWQVRANAAWAFGCLGQCVTTQPVLSALIGLLRDSNPHVQAQAATALGGAGESAAIELVQRELVGLLKTPQVHLRRAATQSLGAMVHRLPVHDTLNALVCLLKGNDDHTRWLAAHALGRGIRAIAAADRERMILPLLELLEHREPRIQRAAAWIFGRLGETAADDQRVLQGLTALLEHRDSTLWQAASGALAELGNQSAMSEARRRLRLLLRACEATFRPDALGAISRLSATEDADQTIHDSLVLMRDPDPMVCLEGLTVAQRLLHGKRSDASQTLLREVLALLRHPETSDAVLTSARVVLATLAATTATQSLLRTLTELYASRNPRERLAAVLAIAALPSELITQKIREAMLASLTDPDSTVRLAAIRRLTVRLQPTTVLPLLITNLDNPSTQLRRATAEAYAHLGEPAATEEVMMVLLRLLENPSTAVAATATIERLGELNTTSGFLATLVGYLRHSDRRARKSASQIIATWNQKGLHVISAKSKQHGVQSTVRIDLKH